MDDDERIDSRRIYSAQTARAMANYYPDGQRFTVTRKGFVASDGSYRPERTVTLAAEFYRFSPDRAAMVAILRMFADAIECEETRHDAE
jgi:hypothetical protein